MSARNELVFMVALLSFVLGTSFKESVENLSEQAECLGPCSQARDERSKTEVKVLSVLSCYHCLNSRKSKQWQPKRIKDPLSFAAKTFTKRHRRSLFLDPSLPTSSTALKSSDCVASSEDNSVPEMLIPSRVDVVFGQYENTTNWYVNVSWTPINDSTGQLYATRLSLTLASTGDINCAVLRKNQTFLSINISFYGYRYPGPVYLLIHGLPYRRKGVGMLTYYPRIPTSSSLSIFTNTTGIPTSSTLSKTTASDSGGLNASSSSTSSATTPFNTSTRTFLTSLTTTKGGANHTVMYASIVSGLLVGLFLVLGLLKCIFLYKQQSRVPLPSGFDYHAFIIFSYKDSDWVVNRLLHPLEKKYYLKCCIHYRDFQVAVPYCENMVESVRKSFKIIAVYSKNFLKSSYCNYELELAENRRAKERDNCLVVIRIDETSCDRLPAGLSERSVIDYSSILEKPFWMGRLQQFLRPPEETDNQDTVTGQERSTTTATTTTTTTTNSTNSRRDSRPWRKKRSPFVRLNSTSSNESTVSYV